MSGICGAVGLERNCIDEILLATMLHHIAPSYFGDRNSTVDRTGIAGLAKLHLQEFGNGKKARHGFIDAYGFSAVIDGCVSNREDILNRLPDVYGIEHATNESHAVALAHHYYGRDLLCELDGPFALALWDKRQQSLLLARDRLGEKSLYYWLDPDQEHIVFGSDIKAILAHPMVKAELDHRNLSLHLAFGFVPGPGTLYKGIFKLLPGERLLFTPRNGAEREKYWRLPRLRDEALDHGYCIRKLHDLYMQAVERSIDGCREVAVFLSGGIASSILVLALRELGVPDISTFTIGVTKSPSKRRTSDLRHARLVAKHFGTEHHEIFIGQGDDPKPQLPGVIQHFDDLVMTPDFYSKRLLAEAVRQAGLHSVMTGASAAWTGALQGQCLRQRSRSRLRRRMQRCRSDEERFYLLHGGLFPLEEQARILSDHRPIAMNDVVATLNEYICDIEGGDTLRRLLFSNLLITAAENSARVLDKVCGMETISVRSPALDRALVEFSTLLPISSDDGAPSLDFKSLMQEVFGKQLPAAVLKREPMGYPNYFWHDGELDSYHQRLLCEETILEAGVFNPEAIQEILAMDRMNGTKSAGERAWALTQFSLWHQIHIRQNESFLTV